MVAISSLRRKYAGLRRTLNERTRRLWAATEAREIGRGGIRAVCRATGLSYGVVARGITELRGGNRLEPSRIRRPGAGRKKCTALDPTLVPDLEGLVEPVSRGDPRTRLRWTCKSLRRLSDELKRMGHHVSYPVVGELLHGMGYSLQANRKTREGKQHPDRNAQFEFINASVVGQQDAGEPAISVDTKKKELVGNFKNGGKEWRPQGQPQEVNVHDFKDETLGKVAPYGVYDLTRNAAWVSLGIAHDTAQFAVATIERWWRRMGKAAYPRACSLLITADAGGSNAPRTRLWRWELQGLADRTGLALKVRHFPPGTSKWNKIEHRLFAYITRNWRGHPLITRAAIVNLIASTRTDAGLRVRCELDRRRYEKGIQVSDEQLARVLVDRETFHGDWNYTIRPREGR